MVIGDLGEIVGIIEIIITRAFGCMFKLCTPSQNSLDYVDRMFKEENVLSELQTYLKG